MSRSRLLARRAGAHRGLLVLLCLLVAAVTAGLGATLGSVQASAAAAARTGLPEGASVTVTTRLAEDAVAQDERVRAVVADLFPGVPLDVVRSQVADPREPSAPFVTWTLRPAVAALVPGDLRAVAAGSAGLRGALRTDEAVAVRGLTVEDSLGPPSAELDAALTAAGAVALVPVTLLGLVSLVALVQVARLVGAVRGEEVALLVSRGASVRQIAGAATLEASVVALAGALAGTAVAAVVVPGVAGGAAGAAAGAATVATVALPLLAVALGVGTVAVVVLGAVAVAGARAVARRGATERSGRVRRAAAGATVVLTVALALLCAERLHRAGSPLVGTTQGVRTDPLAAAAPALALAASAVVVLALLGPLAAAGERVASRGRGVVGALVARQVARGLGVVAVPVVLLVLAAGSVVLAGAFAGTAERVRDDAAALRVGTDVRVRPGTSPGTQGPVTGLDGLTGLEGVAAAAPAREVAAAVGQDPVRVLALPAAQVPRVVRAPGVDVERLAAAIEVSAPQDGALPAVVSRALADRLGLAPGDRLDLRAHGATLPVTTALVVPAVPGASSQAAVLVDLGALAARLPEGAGAAEVWVAAVPGHGEPGTAAALAARVADAVPGAQVVTARPGSSPGAVADPSGSVRRAAWVAAAGTVVLGLGGVLAVAVATLRARRGEVVVLRAVGTGPRAQAWARAGELLAAGGAAVVLGAGAGALVALSAVPLLARATVPGAGLLDVEVVPATVPTAAGLALLAAGVVAVAAATGARVAGQARDTTWREEVR
ncbi:hypothetical protein DNL40_01345 [Xylanimonas oleitrophica]|uniref:FtsX-like permease family protein n=1 Tax=Xylanimonas oleitrophica TaxID=2607479 RepID=A0A2W5X2H6_9MICO|nr:hypothetical protein [Xylanimonas oleitrophica]PZR55066.1 hypothetical protein DNL40_01345 [Xylanimonas oleitrophica]